MVKVNLSEELLMAIDNKLALLLKISGIRLMEGANLSERIRELEARGFDKKDIELITGAKRDTIQKTIKRAKSKK